MKGAIAFEYVILASAAVVLFSIVSTFVAVDLMFLVWDTKDIIRSKIETLRIVNTYRFVSSASDGLVDIYYAVPDGVSYDAGTGTLSVPVRGTYSACSNVCYISTYAIGGDNIENGNITVTPAGVED